jgi:isoamylase
MLSLQTSRGRPLPLGASRTGVSLNFAVLSRHATDVTLVILPEHAGNSPLAEFQLDPRTHRTGDHWHIRVDGLPDTFCYGWRVDGPVGPRHRFDPSHVLIDPCCTVISNGYAWNSTCEVDPTSTSRRSLYSRSKDYNWENDSPPLTRLEDTIIYEMHVRGFTQHGSSLVAAPGTFNGVKEKIPYLKWLGITAIELLPVHEFYECDCPFYNPATGEKLVNFWGYNSIAFAAPKSSYAETGNVHDQVYEFRDLVKACHQAGIEVYLDVVFNHTGEGDDRGRTYSFRGLDNELYYMMDDKGRYLNYSGCGNTLNCNHPLVRDLMLTCLRYWVGDMHVDGFRFDLASILGRDRDGNVMVEPPIVEMIAEDGVLADTKLIAEPWDAAGLYQVGGFPFGRRWSEWNGKYRDDVRDFWCGTPGKTSVLATRLAGSSDLYHWNGRLPRHSINFITCHDGFTLNDLVSYNHKHNEANGEQNRDGTNDNRSWNSGAEGETDDPKILELRQRRAKGMLATLFLSQGVPMLLGGDEFLRTQKGNNNAWCQDNEVSWFDWRLTETNKDFLRFVRELIWIRRRHPVFRRRGFFVGKLGPVDFKQDFNKFPSAGPVRPGDAGLAADRSGRFNASLGSDGLPRAVLPEQEGLPLADIHWHGTLPNRPDYSPRSHTLAYTLDGRFTGRDGDPDYHIDNDFYVAMNSSHLPENFTIPPSPTRRRWRWLINTAAPSPQDLVPEQEGAIVKNGDVIEVVGFGLIVLISEP